MMSRRIVQLCGVLCLLAACEQDDLEPADAVGSDAVASDAVMSDAVASDANPGNDGGPLADGWTGDENVDCPEYERPADWPPQPYVECTGLDADACEAAWNCGPVWGLARTDGVSREHYAGCYTWDAYCFSGGCADSPGCIVHETDSTQPALFLSSNLCFPPGWRLARQDELARCDP